MRKLHLDSEYKNRWIEFSLANGTVEDSRVKNWREVAWDSVVQLTVYMNEKIYTVNCSDPKFKAFMNFRWGGQEAVFADDGTYVGHKPINIWTVGWTDGINCYLKDIDFFTGSLIKEYISPLSNFKSHIHPLVAHRIGSYGK